MGSIKKPKSIFQKKPKVRKCLKCGRKITSPYPGLCEKCINSNRQYDWMAEGGSH